VGRSWGGKLSRDQARRCPPCLSSFSMPVRPAFETGFWHPKKFGARDLAPNGKLARPRTNQPISPTAAGQTDWRIGGSNCIRKWAVSIGASRCVRRGMETESINTSAEAEATSPRQGRRRHIYLGGAFLMWLTGEWINASGGDPNGA
jgi:hypothetical protein